MSRAGRAGIVALVVLLLVGGIGGYFLLRPDDDGDAARTANSVAGVPGLKPGVPTILSLKQLENLGAEQGPIYWAGPRDGTRYEVTVTTAGGTYIRYLPAGAKVGSTQEYLTVGTYASLEGYNALAAAKKRDADVVVSDSGAVIATFKSAPLSTYFAFPDGGFQVEVFSPVEGEARQLTESGAIGLVKAG